MKGKRQTISGQCPVCDEVLPFGVVIASQRGWWNPVVNVELNFDYTDYVAHMWWHQS